MIKYLPYVLTCADGWTCLDVGQLILKYVLAVITDGKLLVKYGNLRKRSEESKIVFAFVSDYFYRYRFRFFDYRYHFRLGQKLGKRKLKNDFRKSEIVSFSFSSLVFPNVCIHIVNS